MMKRIIIKHCKSGGSVSFRLLNTPSSLFPPYTSLDTLKALSRTRAKHLNLSFNIGHNILSDVMIKVDWDQYTLIINLTDNAIFILYNKNGDTKTVLRIVFPLNPVEEVSKYKLPREAFKLLCKGIHLYNELQTQNKLDADDYMEPCKHLFSKEFLVSRWKECRDIHRMNYFSYKASTPLFFIKIGDYLI